MQVAGYFGKRGIEDARWCAYTRVSMWGRAAYGLLGRGYVRSQMSSQGVVITDDDEFYRLSARGMDRDLYLARYLDCVMVSNDRVLIGESYQLAQGNTHDVEPLGPSSHFVDGVRKPLTSWSKRTGVEADQRNVLELHLQPKALVDTL